MLDDYRSYYDEESIMRVADLYKRDVQMFGYEFDPCHPDETVEASNVR
jgi:hypothetical protein